VQSDQTAKSESGDPGQRVFALITDSIQIESTLLPFDLGHDIFLRAPNQEEQARLNLQLDAELKRFELRSEPEPRRARFESTRGADGRIHYQSSDHRYFGYDIHEQTASVDTFSIINDVTRLLEPEMVPGFAVAFFQGVTSTRSFGPAMNRSLLRTSAVNFEPIPTVQAETIGKLRDLVALRLSLTDYHAAIKRALRYFEEIDSSDPRSAAWFLGHFSTLECLLTHKPLPVDTTDSLGRQLKTSIPILLRRSGELADHGGVEAVRSKIAALYDLRSSLVHGEMGPGGHPTKGVYQTEGWDSARENVRQLTKAVLRGALEEPDLTVDLKGPARK
jgi:Apea-like HEPN